LYKQVFAVTLNFTGAGFGLNMGKVGFILPDTFGGPLHGPVKTLFVKRF